MNQIKEFFEYILNAIKILVIVQPWEQGIRVRCGNNIKLIKGGIYFKLPYFDSVYVQSSRLRVVSIAMQTLTTKNGSTISVTGALGYQIVDIEKLYNKLFHPELTISNMAMGELAEFVYSIDIKDISPSNIEEHVLLKLKKLDYGISIEYFRLTNFAIVKTFRLIQDQTWIDNGINLDVKK